MTMWWAAARGKDAAVYTPIDILPASSKQQQTKETLS